MAKFTLVLYPKFESWAKVVDFVVAKPGKKSPFMREARSLEKAAPSHPTYIYQLFVGLVT
jgi:hypothetical protein